MSGSPTGHQSPTKAYANQLATSESLQHMQSSYYIKKENFRLNS